MAKATVKFRPIERQTLDLLMQAHKTAGGDAVATYSVLISAAMVAGAILGLTPQQAGHQAPELMHMARAAVRERPDIFGPGGEG